MTLKKLQDMRSRSGVTLVELLVVILIVMILAVGLLPTFKKFVVQAQYASEPASLVGHIRTQIALYQYEHNMLPVTNDTSYLAASGDGMIFSYRQPTGGGAYELQEMALPSAASDWTPNGGSATADENLYLKNMDLGITEYQGNRVAPQHVQFAVLENATRYAYAIGVFGDGTGLPANTGYAVFEAFLPQIEIANTTSDLKGYKFVATWNNYNGNGADSSKKQILFGGANVEGLCPIGNQSDLANADNGKNVAAIQTSLVDAYFKSPACGRWTYTPLPQ